MFIAIDGIDGAGKTTLVRQLHDLIGSSRVVVTKEPTDESEWGRRLRDSATLGRLPREIELDYFHRDRLEHLTSTIIPALKAGKIVLCDRFVDSTLAFQADNPVEAGLLYDKFRPELSLPNLTMILDCSVELGLERINRDRQVVSKFEKVETLRKAAVIYASRLGPNYVHLNATGTPMETLEQAVAILRKRCPECIPGKVIEAANVEQSSRRAQQIA